MIVIATHTMELPEGGGAPDWVHLLPAGSFKGVDGRGPYHADDAAAVIAASMAAGKLVVDVNHATDKALETGQPAPAQGWITDMEARADGVWGKVDWTPPGTAAHAQKAYRGISPVFGYDKATGRVSRVLRAALTNAPNIVELTTLHTQQGSSMDLAAQIRQALGLAETADDAAIVAAVKADRTAIGAHSQQLASIAAAAGAASGASAEAIATAVQERGTAKLNENVALQTRVLELETASKRRDAEAAVDAAMRAGKPIPATSREEVVAMHMADPAGAKKWIDMIPSITGGGLGGRTVVPPAAGDVAGLSGEDHQVIAMMGLDPKEYAKRKGEAISLGAAA